MADGVAAAAEFGPQQKMTLDAEVLQALTAGDKARMVGILSRHEHGAAAADHRQQTDGQVAINVRGGAAPCSTFLLGVASNGNTALHLVASRGHVELATLLCERAPSLVATRNRCLDTPLHCAAKSGHRDVVAVLLPTMQAVGGRGAEEQETSALRARNETGATALYEAVRHGHAGVVDLLMTEAPHLSSVATEDGTSPLYLAAMAGSAQMVRAMLRPSRDGTPSPASFSGPMGRTALHAAVGSSKEIGQAILDWEPQGPALLTRADSSGRTPLHFAVLRGELDIVQMFLQHGNDSSLALLASISDDQGSFPLHSAAMMGDTRIVDELVKRSPDYCEMVDGKGRNLLHRAVEHGQDRVVRHICQNDMFAMLLNATDSDGNTSLHLAVKYEHPRIVSLLLATASVEMGVTNKDRLTAGDLALRAIELKPFANFQDSHVLVFQCLWWSRAPITVDGYLDLYVDNKLAVEEASKGKNDKAESRTVASALIATVTFAAAFTVPGGFVADDHVRAGTAILARRFAFRAFVVSDAMAFFCSIVATCFLIDARFRRRYVLASGLVPLGAQFMIAAFAFGFHLVLGSVNRWLIVFVYTLSLASVLFAFPGIWTPMHLGLGKAVWRRAGWRGLVNIHDRTSSLTHLLIHFCWSFLFENLRRTLCTLLISATFVVAILLSIVLPNY